jgi:hypothetical protein
MLECPICHDVFMPKFSKGCDGQECLERCPQGHAFDPSSCCWEEPPQDEQNCRFKIARKPSEQPLDKGLELFRSLGGKNANNG